jgi:hypothetical protein
MVGLGGQRCEHNDEVGGSQQCVQVDPVNIQRRLGVLVWGAVGVADRHIEAAQSADHCFADSPEPDDADGRMV